MSAARGDAGPTEARHPSPFRGGAGGEVNQQPCLREDRSFVTLSVRDTGVGIEETVLPRLFEVFAQADRSLDRSRGGLGLGLALVKGLVELHGGTVWAQSEGPGRGAELMVRLPLAAPAEAPAQETEPAVRATVGPLRVLVVEDNPDSAETLQALLELAGHEVAVAHSGPAGVARTREFRPEVVLCDIGLPGMDGYAVAQTLRREPTTPDTRLIALSGYAQEEDRQRAREAGFDALLAKPASFDAVQQLLLELTGRPAAGAQSPEHRPARESAKEIEHKAQRAERR
jgi:CheY-like chemotaxis protein